MYGARYSKSGTKYLTDCIKIWHPSKSMPMSNFASLPVSQKIFCLRLINNLKILHAWYADLISKSKSKFFLKVVVNSCSNTWNIYQYFTSYNHFIWRYCCCYSKINKNEIFLSMCHLDLKSDPELLIGQWSNFLWSFCLQCK